jgi:hypothetical protein
MYNVKKRRFLPLTLMLLIATAGCILVIVRHNSSVPRAGKPLSRDALSTVTKYIQAREGSLGADMNTPDSWLVVIKPIVTSSWYATLSPSESPSTGSVPADFTTAHQNGYIVKAILSNCSWDAITTKPSESNGLVVCNLTDKTLDKNSGVEAPITSLPFAWPYTGRQSPPQLSLTKQADKWLVNGDSTGQAQ